MFHAGERRAFGVSPAVIGKRLADLLKVQTGDYLTLLVKDKHETFNTIELEITGVIYTGNPWSTRASSTSRWTWRRRPWPWGTR